MRLFIALMLVSFNLFANVEWNNLELDQELKLTQSFQLKQKITANSLVDLMKGEQFVVRDIIGLDMIKVVLYKLEYKNCPGPAMTEMEIIPVNNTSPVVEIGAQLVENCELEIYIENKDLMTPSIFE